MRRSRVRSPPRASFQILKSLFFEQAFNSSQENLYYLLLLNSPASKKTLNVCIYKSRVAQWKRAGSHNPEVSGSKPLPANAIKPSRKYKLHGQIILFFRLLPKAQVQTIIMCISSVAVVVQLLSASYL